MSSDDEVKQATRVRPSPSVQSLMDLARRSVPDLRRNAETIEPVAPGRGRALGGALVERARRTLEWTRLPGLRPREARPPERMVKRLFRSYALFALLPTAVVGLYVFVIASPQYIVESQFAVRGNVEPMASADLGLHTDLILKHNSQDSFILRDFIGSRPMVEAVDAKLGLAKMFSEGGIDFWARYDDSQPVEKLVRYWRRHVIPQIDAISGVIHLKVRAFKPEDAVAISQEVIARSETLVNGISRRAQDDMITNAKKEVEQTAERLKQARVALQEFRNRWGIIDPVKSAEAAVTTIELLRKDKIKAENDLRVLRDSKLDEKSRSIQVLVARIREPDGRADGGGEAQRLDATDPRPRPDRGGQAADLSGDLRAAPAADLLGVPGPVLRPVRGPVLLHRPVEFGLARGRGGQRQPAVSGGRRGASHRRTCHRLSSRRPAIIERRPLNERLPFNERLAWRISPTSSPAPSARP
jgi:capsular polysaccharide transport system permease protein